MASGINKDLVECSCFNFEKNVGAALMSCGILVPLVVICCRFWMLHRLFWNIKMTNKLVLHLGRGQGEWCDEWDLFPYWFDSRYDGVYLCISSIWSLPSYFYFAQTRLSTLFQLQTKQKTKKKQLTKRGEDRFKCFEPLGKLIFLQVVFSFIQYLSWNDFAFHLNWGVREWDDDFDCFPIGLIASMMAVKCISSIWSFSWFFHATFLISLFVFYQAMIRFSQKNLCGLMFVGMMTRFLFVGFSEF